LIGVLHHLDGDDAKGEILRSIRARLKPGAALIVAGNQTGKELSVQHWPYGDGPNVYRLHEQLLGAQ
jgi:hypothetical protein